MFGVWIAFMAGVAVILCAWEICMVTGLWRLFEKAGESGWKAMFPGYNIFIQYRLTWDEEMFFVWMVLVGAYVMSNWIGGVFYVIGAAAGVGMTAIWMIGNFKLAEAYGKGLEYALMLAFLYPVGILMLAFGDSEYVLDRDGFYGKGGAD